MYLKPFSIEDDFDDLKSWIENETIHTYWCADSFRYPLDKSELSKFLAENRERFGMLPFMAFDDSRPFGFICIQPESTDGHSKALLRLIIVNAKERGKGYGQKLLQLTTEYAREIKIQRLELNVFSENNAAVHCYEKSGFHIHEDNEIVLKGIPRKRHFMVQDIP